MTTRTSCCAGAHPTEQESRNRILVTAEFALHMCWLWNCVGVALVWSEAGHVCMYLLSMEPVSCCLFQALGHLVDATK